MNLCTELVLSSVTIWHFDKRNLFNVQKLVLLVTCLCNLWFILLPFADFRMDNFNLIDLDKVLDEFEKTEEGNCS